MKNQKNIEQMEKAQLMTVFTKNED